VKPKQVKIPDGMSFCMCDGCGAATPFGQSREECRIMGKAHGWRTDVGELSEDYCQNCVKEGRHELPG